MSRLLALAVAALVPQISLAGPPVHTQDIEEWFVNLSPTIAKVKHVVDDYNRVRGIQVDVEPAGLTGNLCDFVRLGYEVGEGGDRWVWAATSQGTDRYNDAPSFDYDEVYKLDSGWPYSRSRHFRFLTTFPTSAFRVSNALDGRFLADFAFGNHYEAQITSKPDGSGTLELLRVVDNQWRRVIVDRDVNGDITRVRMLRRHTVPVVGKLMRPDYETYVDCAKAAQEKLGD